MSEVEKMEQQVEMLKELAVSYRESTSISTLITNLQSRIKYHKEHAAKV
jgi:hypothetical protein